MNWISLQEILVVIRILLHQTIRIIPIVMISIILILTEKKLIQNLYLEPKCPYKYQKNMKVFRNLTEQQKQALLKFPAYISLLASTGSKMDEAERMVAIKFAHTKAFSCQPLLSEFCRESEIVFADNLTQLEAVLPKNKNERDVAIRIELLKLEMILLKLGKEYGSIMHQSMKTFKEHVLKAHHSVIEDFLFPISIPGLSD